MVYRRFDHGTVNTLCDEYGTVLASYYATTVCYRSFSIWLLNHTLLSKIPAFDVREYTTTINANNHFKMEATQQLWLATRD